MAMLGSVEQYSGQKPRTVPTFNYLTNDEAERILKQGNLSPDTYNAILEKSRQNISEDTTQLTPEQERQAKLSAGEDLKQLSAINEERKKSSLETEEKEDNKDKALEENLDYWAVPQEARTPVDQAPVTQLQASEQQVQQPTQKAPAQQVTGTFDPNAPFQKQISSLQKQASLVQDQASKDAQAYEAARLTTQKIEDTQQQLSSRHIERMQGEMDKLDLMKEDYAKTTINASNFWSDMTTGNKILAGISLALGAIGASVDGKNRVTDIFENAITRDISVQKANLDKKGQAVQAERGVLSDMRAQFGDEASAVAATKAIAYDRLKMQIEENALRVKGPMAQAQAQGLIADVEVKRNNTIMEFAKLRQNSPSMINASQTDREIFAKVPEKDRHEAIKESEEVNKIEDLRNSLKQQIVKIREKPVLQKIKEGITRKDPDEAAFTATIGKVFKGDPSRMAAFERKVKPFLSGILVKGDLEEQLKGIDTIIDSELPIIPTLRMYGIQPKKQPPAGIPNTQDERLGKKVNK